MKNYKTHYENTIINNIDLESYSLSNDINLFDKVKTVYDLFKIEFVHNNNNHLNEVNLFAEWLQGLPSLLTVPFYYDEIINNAISAGIKIKDEVQFCENYWNNLAHAFFTLKNNL